ncbi:MAG TPA: IS481 family transposase [Candidatus Binatia bacterium]
MPWGVVSLMSLRQEFVGLWEKKAVSFTELCQRYQISRKTGYKWLGRYQSKGGQGLIDQSRRPKRSPARLSEAREQMVVQLRQRHPRWGARKIRRLLKNQGQALPAASTITALFHRHGLIEPSTQAKPNWQRFERQAPNSLWQMDFKGPVATLAGSAHALTVLDDHSRFNLCLKALPNQKGESVKQALTKTFRLYGLPNSMIMDNGSPWGGEPDFPYTTLTMWLIRLNVGVSHSRPYHPQTMGKDERFHGTLNRELLDRRQWKDLWELDSAFERFREQYNFFRPHQALNLEVPASHYQMSLRCFPEILPPIEYDAGLIVRKVQGKGEISFRGKTVKIGRAFHGYPVGIKATSTDGLFEVLFCCQTISQIDLREP